ncbi:hypothetical protein KOR34_48760 [Posidoniimonas corsicana]|uniref:Uncharacterized protein n=1 Tax=Posidoniimonas corsicana TaxID=1938618 RepID=A0A5C5UVX6_9BACT|nr:hypothetical protein [Posidoniimonas corsicana]TWT30318.1 hypothetical protein KOR34_48760 [Posidoniimonas corsicana]
MNLILARTALLEHLSTTSQIIVGVSLLCSLAFVIWLLTRRAKG